MMDESMLSTQTIVLVCSPDTWVTQYATGMNWMGLLPTDDLFSMELGLES